MHLEVTIARTQIPYLTAMVLPLKYKKAFAKLRFSNHKLNIEVGSQLHGAIISEFVIDVLTRIRKYWNCEGFAY